MRFKDELSNIPSDLEVKVFRKFFAKIMLLQKHLCPSYHDDKFLKDILMTAVDIPLIQIVL